MPSKQFPGPSWPAVSRIAPRYGQSMTRLPALPRGRMGRVGDLLGSFSRSLPVSLSQLTRVWVGAWTVRRGGNRPAFRRQRMQNLHSAPLGPCSVMLDAGTVRSPASGTGGASRREPRTSTYTRFDPQSPAGCSPSTPKECVRSNDEDPRGLHSCINIRRLEASGEPRTSEDRATRATIHNLHAGRFKCGCGKRLTFSEASGCLRLRDQQRTAIYKTGRCPNCGWLHAGPIA
jgi:hypothetical protein